MSKFASFQSISNPGARFGLESFVNSYKWQTSKVECLRHIDRLTQYFFILVGFVNRKRSGIDSSLSVDRYTCSPSSETLARVCGSLRFADSQARRRFFLAVEALQPASNSEPERLRHIVSQESVAIHGGLGTACNRTLSFFDDMENADEVELAYEISKGVFRCATG
jgi:hypothetical protein